MKEPATLDLVSNVVKQHLAQQKKVTSIEDELKAAVEEIATSKSSEIENMANTTEETAPQPAITVTQPAVAPSPPVDEAKKQQVVQSIMSLVEKKQPKKHSDIKSDKQMMPKVHKKTEIKSKHNEVPAKSTKVSEKGDKKQVEADTFASEPHPEVESVKKVRKHKAPKKKHVEVIRKLPKRVIPVRDERPIPWNGDISENHIHELARHTVVKSHDLEQLISKQQELKDAGRSLDGAQATLLAERRKIEADLARVIKEKESSSQNDAEK